jgi:serine/threonine protein kinase
VNADAPGYVHSLAVLCEDGERLLCRGQRNQRDDHSNHVLAVLSAYEHPTPGFVAQLNHEYGLREELDGEGAVRPLELVRERGRTMLVLEDYDGEPIERVLVAPLQVGHFLHLAITIAAALGKVHQRGLIHKDIKPSNILVNCADGRARLTGFGIASPLPRERQSPDPPEIIAGTLAYMAPEQTGRMNRSIDSRSDLYSFGVTLHQIFTGILPFSASDPMEWVHCHIARPPTPPNERLESVPVAISQIILKPRMVKSATTRQPALNMIFAAALPSGSVARISNHLHSANTISQIGF